MVPANVISSASAPNSTVAPKNLFISGVDFGEWAKVTDFAVKCRLVTAQHARSAAVTQNSLW